MIADPKRLSDEDDAELAAAIGAARRRVPSRDRMNAMAGRLAALGVAVPPEFRPELTASELPAAVPASGAVSKGGVLALGVAGVALVGAVAWLTLGSEPPAPRESAPPPSVRAPDVPVARDTVVPPEAPVANGVAAAPPAEEPAAESVAAPTEADTKASGAVAVAPRKQQEPAAPPGEIELLKRARSALSPEPSLSLQLVERARQTFPRSSFGQEREFIAISALYKLGRRAEADARERAFRERHPRSAYLPQLDRLSSGR